MRNKRVDGEDGREKILNEEKLLRFKPMAIPMEKPISKKRKRKI